MTPEFVFTGRARPIVQVGIGDSGADSVAVWDDALWDDPDALWSGAEPSWRDITCHTVRYETEVGRSATIGRFEAGTATILVVNATGWADPTHVVTPGQLSMRPGRQIRCGIDHTEYGVVWLFRGYIDSMTPRYDPDEPDLVQIDAVDALGEVGRAKMKPLAIPVGASELASTRINRILDAVAWPASRRDIDVSGDDLLETDLGGQVAELLGQAADSTGGFVFGDTTGNVCFRNDLWQLWDPVDPPDAIIANDTVGDVIDGSDDVVWGSDDVVWGGGGGVCPTRWERPFDRADISTRVIAGRDAATATQVDDVLGQGRYGIEPFELTDLLTESDARIAALAARILYVRDEYTAPSVRSVTLNAATSTASLDLQTTLSPFTPTRVRCRLRYPRGVVFDEMHFVTAVRHQVEPGEWETLVNLDRAEPFAAVGAFWEAALWDDGEWVASPATTALLDELAAELDAWMERV